MAVNKKTSLMAGLMILASMLISFFLTLIFV